MKLLFLRDPRNEDPAAPVESKELSDDEIRRLFLSFGMVLTKADHAAIVKRLVESADTMAHLTCTCPGLAQDPVAMAMLARPEMLLMLMKKETLRKVAAKHPALIEAMNILSATVHEEIAKSKGGAQQQQQQQQQLVNPFEYAMDELDAMDDDDEDEDDDMDVGEGGGSNAVRRDRSFSAITPGQLQDAIRSAQSTLAAASGGGGAAAGSGATDMLGGFLAGMTGMAPRPPQQQQQQSSAAAPSSSSSSTAAPFITNDMFRAAMQQAMGAVASNSTANPNPTATPSAMETSSEDNVEESLKTMREMGIADEGLARKALKVMGGDLQAAVDLILSGWLGEDESAD